MRWSPLPPSATALWRVALAIPLWALALVVSERRASPKASATTGATLQTPLVLAGLFFAADLCLWHVSILRTSVANATLLANLAPLVVAAASFLLFRERFGRLHLAALALSLGGVTLLLGGRGEGGAGTLSGDLYGIATAFAYAGYLLSVERARRRHSTAAVMTAVGLAATPALLLAAILEPGPVLPASWAAMGPVLALAVVAQGFGQGAVAFGLARLPASFGSLVLLLQPVLAALLAWPLFGERPGGLEAAGGVAVLVGIALAQRARVVP